VPQKAATRVVLGGSIPRVLAVDVLLKLKISLMAAVVRNTKGVENI
jgi:hypothetical protein